MLSLSLSLTLNYHIGVYILRNPLAAMNNIEYYYRESEQQQQQPWCYFHKEEVIIGVCPMCLNERLVVLAAKQLGDADHTYDDDDNNNNRNRSSSRNQISSNSTTAKQRIRFRPSKIFSLGSLLNRFQLSHDNHTQFHYYSYTDASTSPEDSFISIKFEENGVPSWEKNKVSNVPLEDYCNISWSKETTSKSVVEHIKPRGSSLRWRKRIGHLFQPRRWKRPTKGSGVGGSSTVVEGVKVRSGWIRSLTKRRRAME